VVVDHVGEAADGVALGRDVAAAVGVARADQAERGVGEPHPVDRVERWPDLLRDGRQRHADDALQLGDAGDLGGDPGGDLGGCHVYSTVRP
jgi:hypothetical protein